MRYLDSLRFVTAREGWFVNLVMCAVCIIIPVIGPIVLMGYLFEVFDALRRDPSHRDYPLFTFDRFSPYLGRGIWVFLVHVIVQTLISVPIGILSFVMMMIGGALAKSTSGASMLLAWLLMMALSLGVGLLSALVVWPMSIHAGVKQKFDFSGMIAFTKDFARRNWKETLLAQLFLMAVSLVLAPLGFLAFCVGIYLVAAVLMLAQHHLEVQIYELHLQRGGIPIEEKPLLNVEIFAPSDAIQEAEGD